MIATDTGHGEALVVAGLARLVGDAPGRARGTNRSQRASERTWSSTGSPPPLIKRLIRAEFWLHCLRQAALTAGAAEGPGDITEAAQGVTELEALRAIDAAHAALVDDRRGVLAPGHARRLGGGRREPARAATTTS